MRSCWRATESHGEIDLKWLLARASGHLRVQLPGALASRPVGVEYLQHVNVRDNGKENGNYCSVFGHILGLYRDNGKMEATIVY